MAQNEYGRLTRVALRHARTAFGDQARVDQLWQAENYHSVPNYVQAVRDYETFSEVLAESGAEIVYLPAGADLGLDSIYVRDGLLSAPGGLVLCAMGKESRHAEPALAATELKAQGHRVIGTIGGTGRLEGGDLVWLDEKTCVVGLTYRTNQEGVDQLQAILGPEVEIKTLDMPHYKGPSDVFHLMSIWSPLDRDLALVYSPLMPIGFRRWLLERDLSLVEVPDQEFEAMACNVLALGPRRCLAVEGCPKTRQRLENVGCEVLVYPADEISRKGEGGPTCLTRPLSRAAA